MLLGAMAKVQGCFWDGGQLLHPSCFGFRFSEPEVLSDPWLLAVLEQHLPQVCPLEKDSDEKLLSDRGTRKWLCLP